LDWLVLRRAWHLAGQAGHDTAYNRTTASADQGTLASVGTTRCGSNASTDGSAAKGTNASTHDNAALTLLAGIGTTAQAKDGDGGDNCGNGLKLHGYSSGMGQQRI
jgi:hypothetical protein